MKNVTATVLIILIFCFAQCEKTPLPNNTSEIPGLPPATQTGANTLGFLLNGVPWVPAGFNGTANLSIDFDPGINNGIFGIAAYRLSGANRSSLGIGVDSLNFLTAPFTRNLTRTSIYRAGFSKFDSCILYSHYDSVFSVGSLTVKKFNRTERIISGEFDFVLSGLGCDTVFVTKGRFDMKF